MRTPTPVSLACLAGLGAATLAGCPKGAPAPVDTWLTPTRPANAICVPAPGEGLKRKDRDAWALMLEALERGEADTALQSANTLTDPGASSLARASIDLSRSSQDSKLDPELGRFLIDLGGDNPDNGCVQYGTSLAAYAAGDLERALSASLAATRLLPDNGEVHAMRQLILMATGARPEEGEPDLAAVATRFPDQPVLAMMHGLQLLAADRPAEAIGPLETALAADLPALPSLLSATRAAGDLERYLPLASKAGLPLGDGGALATADAPVRAFSELLGVDEDGNLTAHIETSEGTLDCVLLWRMAPVTVGNFVGLARGTQPWLDPGTGEKRAAPLYDGTVLHRVIPEFMIQGGDPTGTGSGGPGYKFIDETYGSRRTFDRPGVLAMANSGPNTNGSQWFVAEVPLAYLDGKHTIFGQCDAASVEVVKRIARLPTDSRDKPQEPVIVERIVIGD